MRIIVTGASGFLGKALCTALSRAGHQPVALSRRRLSFFDDAAIPWFHCDLPDTLDPRAFTPAPDSLVHCAYSTRYRSEREASRTNLEGSRSVLEAFRRSGGGQFVFISSVAAHTEAASLYGRMKLQTESYMDLGRDTILRPGLIIGNGGIFLRISETVRRLGVAPLFYGGEQQFQTIWLEDLCNAIVAVIGRQITGRFVVASPELVSIRKLYSDIADTQGGRVRFIRLPGAGTLLLLKAAERLGVTLPVTSENLLGLKAARTFDVATDLAALGISPIPWTEALRRLEC